MEKRNTTEEEQVASGVCVRACVRMHEHMCSGTLCSSAAVPDHTVIVLPTLILACNVPPQTSGTCDSISQDTGLQALM
eukprot:scaffold127207_cov18-Tisochrysis_lutea.AAC.1